LQLPQPRAIAPVSLLPFSAALFRRAPPVRVPDEARDAAPDPYPIPNGPPAAC